MRRQPVLGGIPAIAAAVVVVVGILGALVAIPCSSWMRVTDPEAQGLAAREPAPTPSAPPPPPRAGGDPGRFLVAGHGGVRCADRGHRPQLFALYHWRI